MTDYTKLVEVLRYCKMESLCGECKLFETNDCLNVLHDDAAAAIEELQAELVGSKDAIRILKHNLEMKKPKRGEWIRVQEVDIPGEMHPVAFKCMCSNCRNEYVFPRIPQYCPNCGSRNTEKKEVQE